MAGVLCLLAACARQPVSPPSAPVPAGTPPRVAHDEGQVGYTGLLVSVDDAGVIHVAGFQPGPAAQSGLAPGDRITRCDGAAVDAITLRDRLADVRPGQTLVLDVVRGEATHSIALKADSRVAWQGPAAYAARVAYAPPVEARGEDLFTAMLGPDAAPDLRQVDAELSAHFAALAADPAGYHKSASIRRALRDPQHMLGEARALRARADGGETPRARLLPFLCETLSLTCPATPALPTDPAAFLAALEHDVLAAFAPLPGGRSRLDADLRALVAETSAGHLLFAQPDTLRAITAMRASLTLDRGALLSALADLLSLAESSPSTGGPAVPSELARVAEGDIRAWARVGERYLVFGGPDVNRYHMDGLVAVFDAGGDDVYAWSEALGPAVQIIVDAAGDDRYTASYGGPGAGWLGVGVLLDASGDDHYQTVFGGCGAGLFGFGVLVDAGGNDVYRCDAWSLGAGLYGGGVAIDDGAGGDQYLSQILSQGAGGPGGVGLHVDGGGDDLYRANGLVVSAYGTPAVFMGLSQGVGYGLRPHDVGGIGLLVDDGGNDRYEGGEFSQGGGYFWGVGVLDDAAGDDLYYGNRYAQGFAAHQAAGALIDEAGDDDYWAMTAAAQAAAWDESVAILADDAGNDVYRAEALSQGAAAHQSRALLRDAAGDDVYRSTAASAQGAAGDNDYHWDAAQPLYSLGMLFDGGGADRYSRALAPGSTRIDRGENSSHAGAGTAGLAIDRE